MAVVLGNIALLLDANCVNSARTGASDRKNRPLPGEIPFNLFKRDPHCQSLYAYSTASSSGFEHEKERWNQRGNVRGKANSKVNAVDYENSSDDENGNGFDEKEEEVEDEEFDWENEMRRRLKEAEEMKELESKAEEVQKRVDEEYAEEGENPQETEEAKRLRVKKELEKVAREQAERRKTAQLMFDLGQKAYGRGSYARSIEFLEGALTIIPRPTLFGGEIQIWLAMAYEANNRHADCVALYQQLEKSHPSISIRRQAAELLYIMQAPKLKISQEEMVTIPLIGSSYDSYAGTWTDKYKDRDQKTTVSTTNQLPWTKDYLADFFVWKPPVGLEKSQAFWVALTVWLGLVGAVLFLQR